MDKKCIGIVVSLLAISIVVYKFFSPAHTLVNANKDERTAIELNADEMNLVLAEMRLFLTSVQQITNALAENDMQKVAVNARKVGRASQGDVPAEFAKKLPLEFKKLGFDTHTKFDQLALDAVDLGDKDHALSQLSTLMQNCVSCHATYRLELLNK